jgi:hypothetical protein
VAGSDQRIGRLGARHTAVQHRCPFILLYLLSISSYLRVRGLSLRSVAKLLLLVVLAASLVRSGWYSVYGIVVLLLALAP